MLGDALIHPHSSCAIKRSDACDSFSRKFKEQKNQSRIVVLNLSGDAIKWYPLLLIDHVYDIVIHNSEDVNMFKNQVTQLQLRKVLQEAHTSLVVGFTKYMEIHEVVGYVLPEYG